MQGGEGGKFKVLQNEEGKKSQTDELSISVLFMEEKNTIFKLRFHSS